MTENDSKDKMAETEVDENDDSRKGEKEKSEVKISPFKDETVESEREEEEEKENEKPSEKDDEDNEEEKSSDSKNVSKNVSFSEDLDKSDVITVEDNGDDTIAKKTISDEEFYSKVSEEEIKYYEENAPDPDSVEDMNIHCTACGEQVNHHVKNNIARHPELGVPICRKCKYFYEDEEDGEWTKDESGSYSYCRWCANGGEMICCDACPNAHCKRCITRNLGRKMFNQINDSDTWHCFMCDPKPIFSQRALMYSIYKWSINRKAKLKQKERDQKQKKQQAAAKSKEKEAIARPNNFIDENINEAFDTLKIYQKCLEDERKRWANKKRIMTPENASSVVSKLKKVFSITKQNMELLEKALLQGFQKQFPEESEGKFKSLVKISEPIKSVKFGKSNVGSPSTNGTNKRKMKNTSSLNPNKKMKVSAGAVTVDLDDDDDIAVEEIVMNGEPIMGNEEFFNPAALCSVEITGESDEKKAPKKKQAPAPPKIRPFKNTAPKTSPPKPSGPLRISSKMFQKKSPVKKAAKERPSTPDSDVVEIVSDNEEGDTKEVAAVDSGDVDSDVSLE